MEELPNQNQKQFKSLFMSIPDGFYLSEILYDDSGDPCDYRFIEVNPNFEQMVGLSREQLVGKRYKEIVPVDTTRWLETYCEIARTGRPMTFEFYSNEYQMYFETYSYQPAKGQVAVFVKNITERKQAEILLQNSEERLRQAVRVGDIGIFEHDHISDTFFWSGELQRIYGIDETPSFQGFLDLVHSEDRNKIRAAIDRANDPSGDGIFDTEFREVHRDGQIRWIYARSQTFFEGKGSLRYPVRTIGAVRDITDEKVAKEALLQSKNYAEMLIESANAMIVVLNAQEQIQVFNRAAEKITGYTRQELLGSNWFEVFVPKEKKPDGWTAFLKIGQKGFPKTLESPILTKAGEERTISWQHTGMSENGNYSGTILYGIDISERKRLEEQMLQIQKIEAIGTLAGGIAHDFNNLLGIITGNVSYALSQVNKNQELYDVLGDVQKGAAQAQNLTQQLLTFSKGGEPIKKLVKFNQLVKESAEFVCRGTKAKCKFNLSDDLWSVEVDPGQLNQVIGNLVINANQAMPNGGSIYIRSENFKRPFTNSAGILSNTPADF